MNGQAIVIGINGHRDLLDFLAAAIEQYCETQDDQQPKARFTP